MQTKHWERLLSKYSGKDVYVLPRINTAFGTLDTALNSALNTAEKMEILDQIEMFRQAWFKTLELSSSSPTSTPSPLISMPSASSTSTPSPLISMPSASSTSSGVAEVPPE